LDAAWNDLVTRKLYITGGCGALYDGASPDGSSDQPNITRVHQAFGRDYQLPNATAHNETCAAIGNLLWNWRMLQITGEAKYGDVIEQTLYNSVLAGVSQDGTAFFYTNTLRRIDPMPVELRWSRQRQKTMGCWCCPPNVARTIAQVGVFAFAMAPASVYVVLYGGGTLQAELPDAGPLKLSQETDYPWDGKIRITFEQSPRGELSLMLRNPGWARNAAVRVNGRDDRAPQPGTFHEIRRTWAPGDVVELDLPMPVRLVEANPYVEEARNHVAVMRGPLVYCLESIDLPPGVRALDVHLYANEKMIARRRDDLLGGVTVIEGAALAIPTGDWSGRLYRDFSSSLALSREINVTLIPYYAWDNRGKSEMTVWLPLAR
jgi:DUF1680 family protein